MMQHIPHKGICRSPVLCRMRHFRFFAFLSLLFFAIGCRNTESKPEQEENKVLTAIAFDYYTQGKFDSAIFYWNVAFASFKATQKWDSIFSWTEKYIIAHSRIYKTKEAHPFLDTLEYHILHDSPVDSIELSKLWLRRSEILYTEGKAVSSRDTLLAVWKIRKRHFPADHPLLGDVYDYLELATANMGDYWQAAYYGELCIDIYRKCEEKGLKNESSNLPWAIGNTGECYNSLGDYNRAIRYLNEACQLLEETHAPIESKAFYKILIASCHRKKGDYRNALELLQQAEAMVKQTSVKSFLAEVYGEIALCYKEIGFKKEMLDYAQRQYAIYQEIHKGRDHIEQIQSAVLLATCLIEGDEADKAGSYINDALLSLKRLGDTSILLYTDILSLQGTRLTQLKEYDAALDMFAKALQQRTEKLGADNDQTGLILLDFAKIYHETKAYEKSSDYADRALTIFRKTRGNHHPYVKQCVYFITYSDYVSKKYSQALQRIDPYTNDVKDDSNMHFIDRSSLQLLILKTRLLQPHEKSDDLIAWNTCLNEYIRLADAYQYFLQDAVWEESHFINAESVIKHIKNGVGIAYQAYRLTGEEKYLQYALNLSELSRAQSIRLSLQHYKANKFANVPDSIIQKEEQLRIDKAQLEKLVLDAATTHAPDSMINSWKAQLIDGQRAYGQFVKHLAAAYPHYYKLKMETASVDMKELKGYAQNHQTAIVSYTATDNYLYAIVIKPDTCGFIKLPMTPSQLSDRVATYRKALVEGEAASYNVIAASLYDTIVRPTGIAKNKSICIVPDDVLWYVSFESLVAEHPSMPASFRSLHYSIYDADWCYTFCMKLLLEEGSGNTGHSEWIAIAPGFDRRNYTHLAQSDSIYKRLVKQPWALQLASDLRKRFDAKTFTEQRATETRYNISAKEAAVLYIGTHAFANDEDPMQSLMVFAKDEKKNEEDGYLHAYEVYRSPMHARLVVLGACQTGYGQLRSGEGMVSLANSFAYAGCRRLITSLWSVDDQQTAAILQTFFDNSRSNSINTSLSDAKRSYLQQCKNEKLSNPFYWSGIISIGTDEYLPQPQQSGYTWWIGVPAMILGVIIYITCKRKKNKV